MEEFFKNLRKKISVDNIVEFMKDAKVIDETKEEDVRNTLSKMDPNNLVDVDNLTTKLTNIAQQSKHVVEDIGSKVMDAMGSNIETAKEKAKNYSVLQKLNPAADGADEESPDDDGKEDEVIISTPSNEFKDENELLKSIENPSEYMKN